MILTGRRLVPAALLALLAAGGCASGRLAPGGFNVTSNLVTEKQITRFPEGSAERAFVAWWRDVQYANMTGFTALVPLDPPPRGANALVDALSYLTRPARPTAIASRRRGARTDMRVTVTVRQPVGAGKTVDQRFGVPVRLRRVGAGWRVERGYEWADALAARLRPYIGGNRR